jgi:hypothetical protein
MRTGSSRGVAMAAHELGEARGSDGVALSASAYLVERKGREWERR